MYNMHSTTQKELFTRTECRYDKPFSSRRQQVNHAVICSDVAELYMEEAEI